VLRRRKGTRDTRRWGDKHTDYIQKEQCDHQNKYIDL
jgi:hypothetical protein